MLEQIRKIISIVILVAFIGTSLSVPAMAQESAMPWMPQPGTMVHISPEYSPAYLKGIVIHPDNALKFDFIIYKGDKPLTESEKKAEYTKLTKYFMASLAIPDDDQWVNLSPYEKDRIIKEDFGKTEMGRDLLAQDYMLKQITASLIYPEESLGRKFWDRVYAEAQEKFGTTEIPVNTFNKVWILPDDALIYEKGNTAYVLRNHLRVMLEEDYLSLRKHAGIQSAPINRTHTIASKIVKEVVLPELEREVNQDENFAALRQVYSGMLLATWYKRALKQSLLSKIYANQAKVKGVDQDPANNEMIYQRYLRAYKKGVFNYIREDVDKYTNETIPRKYFSGGNISYDMAMRFVGHDPIARETVLGPTDSAQVSGEAGTNNYDYAQVTTEEPEVAKLDAAMVSRRGVLTGAAGMASLPVIGSGQAATGVVPRQTQSAADNKTGKEFIVDLTERLEASFSSRTRLTPSEFQDVNGLMDKYRDAILTVYTTDDEIRSIPFGQMVNNNYFYADVQNGLLRVMLDIARQKGTALILRSMIAQSVDAFLKQMGSTDAVVPSIFMNYLAFFQNVLADSQLRKLLTAEEVRNIQTSIQTTTDLVQTENVTNKFSALQRDGNPQEAIDFAIGFWRQQAPEHDRLIGHDITIEPDNGWKPETFFNPLIGKDQVLFASMPYSNGQRAIMDIADKIYQNMVVAKGLEGKWQATIEPNLISKSVAPSRTYPTTPAQNTWLIDMETRQLFAEDYLAFIVSGDLARTHWFKDVTDPNAIEGGYNSENNIKGRRDFFNENIFVNRIQAKPTMEDLKRQLRSISDHAMLTGIERTAAAAVPGERINVPAAADMGQRIVTSLKTIVVESLAPKSSRVTFSLPRLSDSSRAGIQKFLVGMQAEGHIANAAMTSNEITFTVSGAKPDVDAALISEETSRNIIRFVTTVLLAGAAYKAASLSYSAVQDYLNMHAYLFAGMTGVVSILAIKLGVEFWAGLWNMPLYRGKLVSFTPMKYVQTPSGSVKVVPADNAMAPGGIDFNSANLNLQIKRDGNGVPLPMSQQDMAQLSQIEGLEPIILSITPATNTSFFTDLLNSVNS